MSRNQQTFRAVSDRAVRRKVSLCAILGGPLLMLLVHVSAVPAQQAGTGTGEWFHGVHRETQTPEVLPSERAETQTPSRRLQLPRRYGGDVRRVQGTAATPVFAQHVEALPSPPQADRKDSPLRATSRVEGKVPITGWDADVDMAQGPGDRIDRLVVRDASLSKVLSLLAQAYQLNVVAANDIDAIISITLRDVALEEALTAILSVANYTWVNRDGIILITSLTDSTQLPPAIQGREVQIFDLDFVSAATVSEAVSSFLSPIGKMSIIESDKADNRRTQEMIVVEDIPGALARIASYLAQVDRPPRQVLIEAHILQVTLKDNEKNGVDFDALARVAGANIHLKTVGFAPTIAGTNTGNGFFATVNGGDLTGVIELLQTTSDTKTLGSPKVLVLNQQEAMVHVGEDLGFQTTVTSELQSTQAPQFLQVGVLLTITPRITRDNRILLHVKPEVSTGVIDPITQVPNKKTTELETDVMLNNGQGMVIGGLIDEQDSTLQSKIPYLGDLWRVGFFFRKSDVTKERKEVIIALVPRIQPYDAEYRDYEQGELIKAQTPLYQGPLCYTDRPFDAQLPDGKRVARPYIPPHPNRPEVNRAPCNNCQAPWPRYYVPAKPYPRQDFVDEYADGCVGEGTGERSTLDGNFIYSRATGQSQPQIAGELVPDFDAGSIISDQP